MSAKNHDAAPDHEDRSLRQFQEKCKLRDHRKELYTRGRQWFALNTICLVMELLDELHKAIDCRACVKAPEKK